MQTSTAAKFMSNAEAKARIFIEKQRKRTATLGMNRSHLYKTEQSAAPNNGGDGELTSDYAPGTTTVTKMAPID